MRPIYLIGMAVLVMGAGIIAGCVEEVMDPNLDFSVLEVNTNSTSPTPEPETADNGTHFLWVKVRVDNQNENNDLTVTPAFFTVDNNADVEEEGKYLANGTSKRGISTIRIDPGLQKEFWVIFNVQDGKTMNYIRYVGSLDEPIEKDMPSY
ncbi:MAG: DUF4352 domain-containing protein [Candidatus Thermoplasmatota archaeon]|nr:DUF4352 domain-containing protein [Candidatus Thermoplasmatota archaeon]